MEYLDVISSPQGSEPDLEQVIIFVHGLNPKGDPNHARKTWTHKDGTFWPEQLLPSLLPTARVLLFAYNSSILKNASNVSLAGHAQSLLNDLKNKRSNENETFRPIMFVAHSLGGLLVKQALIEAKLNDGKYGALKSSTYGIVFFATPHAGGNKAGVADIASKICSAVTGKPSNSLLTTLKKDSLLNEISSDQFAHQVNDYKILNYYEARKMEVYKSFKKFPANMYIVDRNAAKLGSDSRELDRNHSEICKFEGERDNVWERVGPDLKAMGMSARKHKAHDSHARLSSFSAPIFYHGIPIRNPRFIGRKTELKELEKKLFTSDNCRKLAIVGLGGVGKTQLALELIYAVKKRWPEYSVAWLSALSVERFEQAYIEIAIKCSISVDPKVEDPKISVQQYLKSGPKWLLVIDNSDEQEILFGTTAAPAGISAYLPESENVLMLFTTRNMEMAVSLAGSSVIKLEEMNHKEAETFLEDSLIDKESLRDKTISTELLSELTYLPLAIAQAAAYMNKTLMPVPKYLQLLRKTEDEMISLLSREFQDSTSYKSSKNAIAMTWLVSFDQIRNLDPTAADILCFISCIEHKAIYQSILPPVQPEERMIHAIGTLCGYSFLTRLGDTDTFDMHRLVHLATKVWMDKYEFSIQWRDKVAVRLDNIFPSKSWKNRSKWRILLPHAIRFLQNTEKWDNSERDNLCLAVGQCLGVDGRDSEALRWLLQCVAGRKRYLAEDHRARLSSQYKLAMAYKNDGQVDKAIEILEKVVAIRDRVLAEDHPDRLASRDGLARAYRVDGQVDKAIKILEKVVVIREMVLAEDHPDRLMSQHELAKAYVDDGQIQEAIQMLEKVVAIRERLPEDNRYRLASQHSLAKAYREDGQIKKAIKLLEYVVDIDNRLPEDDSGRLISQHELAVYYLEDKQIDRAVELLEKVVAIRERFPEDDWYRLVSQHALAMANWHDGRIDRTVEIFEKIFAIEEHKNIADDHRDRLVSRDELAMAHEANRQLKKPIERKKSRIDPRLLLTKIQLALRS